MIPYDVRIYLIAVGWSEWAIWCALALESEAKKKGGRK
jgi:hypothetical protein